MTQRPSMSISTPPSSYRYPWTHSSNAASDPALTLGLGRPPTTRHHSDRFGIPTPRRSTQPAHYSPSPGMLNQELSGPSTPKTALKVLTSVKRSFSSAVAKKSAGPSAMFTSSTAEETAAAQIRVTGMPSSSKPPTVQQIAAGLGTGLRPTRAPLTRQTSAPLPPPPARSSLKKPLNSGASSSSSTSLASTSLMSTSTRTGSTTTAATSVASSRRARPRFSLKDALFRRSGSASPTPIVPIVTKAVRFSVDRSPVVELTSLPPT
ncbi:hypothetical protein FRC09_017035 [Ceratobasidium sp. 395]|nr:hypothetical protein FRC09_017035 [Ceratobasidium sp. 395]